MAEAVKPIGEYPNDCKLFIGGLSPQTGEEELRSFFSQYGTVVAVEIRTTIDQVTQQKRSRGFGFVVFAEPQYTQAVLGQSSHVYIGGRSVEIKPIDERSTTEGKQAMEERKIFVGGLPEDVTSEALKEYFKTALDPDVTESRVMTHIDGSSRCFGYVTMSSREMVQKAVAMRDSHYMGTPPKWIDVKVSVMGGTRGKGKDGKGKGFDKGGGKGFGGKGFGGYGGGGYGAPAQAAYGGGYGAAAGGYGAAAGAGAYGAQAAYGAAAGAAAYQQQAATMAAYQQQYAQQYAAQYAAAAAAGAGAAAPAAGVAAAYAAQPGAAAAYGAAGMAAYAAVPPGAAQYGVTAVAPARAAPY